MQAYKFVTLDVFTDRRFGGNPLAVFPDASDLSDRQMQALAREFNLSETTFVLPPADPAHTARVRIFTPGGELPFAGHPNVGTGVVLAGMGRDRNGVLLFEEVAGLVEVRVERDATGAAVGAVIAAPQPLSRGADLDRALIAACAGLEADAVRQGAHLPLIASVGARFMIAETSPEALARAVPDAAAFRRLRSGCGGDADPAGEATLSLHLYAFEGGRLRTRMFAPLLGVAEDPATGSANAALAALLLSLGDAKEAAYEIIQGVEMGRPSLLHATARRAPDGIHATIGGRCVPVLRGEALA